MTNRTNLETHIQPYRDYYVLEREIAKLEQERENILFEIAKSANLPVCLSDREGNKRLRCNWRGTIKRHIRSFHNFYPYLFDKQDKPKKRSLVLEPDNQKV